VLVVAANRTLRWRLSKTISYLDSPGIGTFGGMDQSTTPSSQRINKRKQAAHLAMSMEESISLEETNRIRISLGLKPLTDDKAPAGDKDKEAEDNYAKRRQQEARERESK
jgi:HIND motif